MSFIFWIEHTFYCIFAGLGPLFSLSLSVSLSIQSLSTFFFSSAVLQRFLWSIWIRLVRSGIHHRFVFVFPHPKPRTLGAPTGRTRAPIKLCATHGGVIEPSCQGFFFWERFQLVVARPRASVFLLFTKQNQTLLLLPSRGRGHRTGKRSSGVLFRPPHFIAKQAERSSWCIMQRRIARNDISDGLRCAELDKRRVLFMCHVDLCEHRAQKENLSSAGWPFILCFFLCSVCYWPSLVPYIFFSRTQLCMVITKRTHNQWPYECSGIGNFRRIIRWHLWCERLSYLGSFRVEDGVLSDGVEF